ncbi:MAG: hypothetical protein IJ867_05355 [Clostridia bacterium]|nr:hypothetical protein [Clostridia bacterium]
MRLKNRSGVTITVLVITIIVMMIIFGITYSTSMDLLKNSQKNKMKTMLYMVESRAEILLDDYLFENDGKTTEEMVAEANASALATLKGRASSTSDLSAVGLSGTTNPDGTVVYRTWEESVLEKQGIDTKNLAKGDYIVVKYNLATGEIDVASKKGFSNNGTNIHFLSDFE